MLAIRVAKGKFLRGIDLRVNQFRKINEYIIEKIIKGV